jgi:hypothetical protein
VADARTVVRRKPSAARNIAAKTPTGQPPRDSIVSLATTNGAATAVPLTFRQNQRNPANPSETALLRHNPTFLFTNRAVSFLIMKIC